MLHSRFQKLYYTKSDPYLTSETGEVSLQVRVLYFVSQDISLVEEEDDGCVEEPWRMDGGVEQSQTLMHPVLEKKQTHESDQYRRKIPLLIKGL